MSVVQVSRFKLTSGWDIHSYAAVRLLRDLAHKHNSDADVQLASQLAMARHSRGAFDKVKGLISEGLWVAASSTRLRIEAASPAPRAVQRDPRYQGTGVFDVIGQCCSFQRSAALSASEVHVACDAACPLIGARIAPRRNGTCPQHQLFKQRPTVAARS